MMILSDPDFKTKNFKIMLKNSHFPSIFFSTENPYSRLFWAELFKSPDFKNFREQIRINKVLNLA